MTSIDTFLNQIVPDTLRSIQSTYLFIITGTRCLNAYLNIIHEQAIYTQDWDVLYIGDHIEEFSEDIKQAISSQEYKVNIQHYLPSEPDNSLFAFRSRPWIRLSVNLGDVSVSFLDIYSISTLYPDSGMYMNKDGLFYSDLGFLVRELTREEENAIQIIKANITVTEEQIKKKLKTSEKLLENSVLELDHLDEESNELIESMGQVSDNLVRDIAKNQAEELENSKKTLIRVSQERDVLFAAMATGKIPKIMVQRVCEVCRTLEEYYDKYNTVKERCQLIKESC